MPGSTSIAWWNLLPMLKIHTHLAKSTHKKPQKIDESYAGCELDDGFSIFIPKLPRAKRKIRMGKCSLQASHDEHVRMFCGYKRNAWQYVNWEILIYFMGMYGIYKYVKIRQPPTIWVRDISVYLKIVFLPASLAVLIGNMMIKYKTARPPWTSFMPAVNAALQNMFIFIYISRNLLNCFYAKTIETYWKVS